MSSQELPIPKYNKEILPVESQNCSAVFFTFPPDLKASDIEFSVKDFVENHFLLEPEDTVMIYVAEIKTLFNFGNMVSSALSIGNKRGTWLKGREPKWNSIIITSSTFVIEMVKIIQKLSSKRKDEPPIKVVGSMKEAMAFIKSLANES